MPFRALHKKEISGCIVIIVKWFFCTGIITMIHDIEAGQFVIVIWIQNTLVTVNTEIALAVTIFSKFICNGDWLEPITIRSSVIDVCFFFTAVICVCFCRTAAPIVIRGIFLPTRRIIIPIYKLIFCVKQFFEKRFCIAAVFPVCNIAIIGCIKIVELVFIAKK